LRIITDADDTVDDKEMLSVDRFIRELNKDAARDFFLIWMVAVLSVSSASSGVGVVGVLDPEAVDDFVVNVGDDELAFIETSSSSASLNACWALNDNARRRRLFKPPLRTMAALGVGTRIAARSLSSLDIRFSRAVKLPWDKGEGRTGRAWVVVAVAGDGDDRIDVDELVDDDEWFRRCRGFDVDGLGEDVLPLLWLAWEGPLRLRTLPAGLLE
jgi:hypothetical protein